MTIDELIGAGADIPPEKLAFLKAFANMPAGNNSAAMMRQLNAARAQAKEQNIQFTSDEQRLMVELLTAKLSPAEKERVNQVLKLLKYV